MYIYIICCLQIEEKDPKVRKNRQVIAGELNEDDVKEATEKLKKSDIFVSIESSQHLTRYRFTTDIQVLEKDVSLTCKSYIRNTKMVFFAEVARAISAIAFYLQMEILKKGGKNRHKYMLDKIIQSDIMSRSELNRLKTLGKRMCRLTKECGLASLAILKCISCGRMIECSTEVFDQFVETASDRLRSDTSIDFTDKTILHFKEFYEKSLNYIME